ncbi:MAG: tRNA (adenosine(37)-N6)-threonylcarbamoyltransferase complex transferase subunit TsaD [Firmicutes bacterium]|nr:tRNA (adenosine(37)-N6)-threonylcarbamoyltransferase complex transferase subunit TsaD [Bacillota bacterium]
MGGGIVLGLETSCDETAAALVAEGRRVLSSVVASQAEVHRRYGGVVPEIAARRHVEAIGPVLREAFAQAGAGWEDVDAVAVTRGPGLVGALLVGVAAAKAAAFARGLPLVGVNHLAGHIMAAYLEGEPPEWPAVALVVSGSHTDLLWIGKGEGGAPGELRRLGGTRDDAAGEAFDKVARLLGLPYPGGPAIEAAAARAGAAGGLELPRPMRDEGFDFSFSGLKTAVAVLLEERGPRVAPEAVARAFQDAVVDVLVTKTVRAAEACGARCVVAAGGVAANGALRQRLAAACGERGWRLVVPPLRYCTDNAAMIAAAGWFAWRAGRRDGYELDADPDLDFEDSPAVRWM